MFDFGAVQNAWNLSVPPEAAQLLSIEAGAVVAAGGSDVSVPWPPFTIAQICSAASVAEDWNIPKNFLPLGGDFHDLICLDFNTERGPSVVIINDERIEKARFGSIAEFVGAIRIVEDEPTGTNGIIPGKSFLNF
jgi:hypothetical protein